MPLLHSAGYSIALSTTVFIKTNQQSVIAKKEISFPDKRSDYLIPLSSIDSNNILYHHCMPLSQVTCGTVRADPAYSEDSYLLPAYEWLAEQIGFFPHFVSVGKDEYALNRTGYQDQWRVRDGGDFVNGEYRKNYRKKGEFPNLVLLSFDHLEGVFMDHMTWHIAINSCTNGNSVSTREMKMILKPSWTNRHWLRAAMKSHSVELLTPEIPLHKAAGVWVRNRATQKLIEMKGFRNVEVVRTRVELVDSEEE